MHEESDNNGKTSRGASSLSSIKHSHLSRSLGHRSTVGSLPPSLRIQQSCYLIFSAFDFVVLHLLQFARLTPILASGSNFQVISCIFLQLQVRKCWQIPSSLTWIDIVDLRTREKIAG